MNTIQILEKVSRKVLFSHECDNNTVAKTLEYAVARNADLRGADLRDANLCRADLCDANLRYADLRYADLRNADLRDADLRDADLRNVDLRYAVLRGANLRGANLRYADLRYTDLRNADLRDANLRDANLCEAGLRDADLRDAGLCGANLCGAGLRNADLRGANLRDANLRNADLRMALGLYNACPVEGSFIGWKKASGFIVKLLIPADALRSSATRTKCRCNKALVEDIQTVNGGATDIHSVASDYDPMFKYARGSWVEVKDFDTNRLNECAPGIHFFVDRKEAVEY